MVLFLPPPKEDAYEPPDLVSVAATPSGAVRVVVVAPPPVLLKKQHPETWSMLEVLELVGYEVECLNVEEIEGLGEIAFAGAPDMFLGADGEAHAMGDRLGPPWAVHARLCPEPGTPYYSPAGWRVRMLIDSSYPTTPPECNFVQVMHHFFTDNDNGLPPVFYELLMESMKRRAPYRATLRGTLALLLQLLNEPLHPCEGCQSQFDDFAEVNRKRLNTIALYAPQRLHPQLFLPPRPLVDDAPIAALLGGGGGGWERWLVPPLRSALAAAEAGRLAPLRALLTECVDGVYSFPMLTMEFCELLVAELDAYAATDLPQNRPNSMNSYGLVLNEIGMEATFDALQACCLRKIGSLLFPVEGGSLDRHHSFIVQYAAGKDLGLDMHVDNSDVTFNVCLGRKFRGAGLTFCGYMGDPHHRHRSHVYQHEVGRCVVHLGRRRHGADDITDGERINLIVWNHNLAYRQSRAYTELQQQKRYRKEAAAPDAECLSYTHDRDYLKYKSPPTMAHKMTRRAWCPPLHARHDADEIVTAACGTCDDENGGGGEATLLDAKLVQSVLRRAAAQTGDGATVRSALTKALADDDDGFEVFDDPNDESDT